MANLERSQEKVFEEDDVDIFDARTSIYYRRQLFEYVGVQREVLACSKFKVLR